MTKTSEGTFAVSVGGMREQLRKCHKRLGDLSLNTARLHTERASVLLVRDEVLLAEGLAANPRKR